MKSSSKKYRQYNFDESESYNKNRRNLYKLYVNAAKLMNTHKDILEDYSDIQQREINKEVLDHVIEN